MAITFAIKAQKKQKYLLLAFLAIILITGLIVWLGFFRKEKATPEIAPAPPPKEIKINFGLLDSSAFKDLWLFEGIAPLGGPAGRPNPFLKY